MKQNIWLLFLTLNVLLGACTRDSEKKIDVSQIPVTTTIHHLEKELFALKSKQEIREFLQKNPLLTEKYFQTSASNPDSLLINDLYHRISNESLRKFYEQIEGQYANVNDLEKQFTDAFRHIKYYFPEFKPPQVCTMITGFLPNKEGSYIGRDLMVSDSLIVIGIDFFMGAKAMYVPDIQAYMLKNMKRENIVPTVVLGMSNRFNVINEKDETLLAEMVAYGKSLEFVNFAMPETPDSLIIGYTSEQIKEIEKNKSLVWTYYVEQKLFFNTNHMIKPKYIGARPYTVEIGTKCPPRTGWWLGWQIVRKYLKTTRKTLPELMKNPNAQEIFSKSGYKGE
jgi:gliding motility-associated lipoprotein GldB